MWLDISVIDECLYEVGYDGDIPDNILIVNKTNLYWRFLGRDKDISYIIYDYAGKIILSLNTKNLKINRNELNKLLLNILKKERLLEDVLDHNGELNNNIVEFRLGDLRDIETTAKLMAKDGILLGYKINSKYNEIMYDEFISYKNKSTDYLVVGGVISSEIEENVLEDYSYNFIDSIIKIPESEKSIFVGETITMIIEESNNGSPQMVFYNNELRR